MSDDKRLHPDDELLIDFLTGQCPPAEAGQVQDRLASDEEFSRRADKASGLLKLLDCYDAPEPDEALIAGTIAAARSAAQTSHLLDVEAARTRSVTRATFTWKELAAMAALVFIVATVLVPSFRHAGRLARDQACLAQVGQIGAALTNYANANLGRLPALAATDAAWLADSPAPARVMSNSRNLWQLVRGGYANAGVFQCPAGGRPQAVEQAKAGMLDFPAPRYISYSYHNGVNSKPLLVTGQGLRAVAAEMAILADSTPVFIGGRFDPSRLNCDISPNHKCRGQAVLYLDMHVSWTDRATVGVGGDNIWLAQGVYQYKGTELPASEADSFLLPSFVEDRR
jgi:hypothetical protein